jgi:hypothetical protein
MGSVVLGLLIVVTCGMWLMLYLCYADAEQGRAKGERSQKPLDQVASLPRFFASQEQPVAHGRLPRTSRANIDRLSRAELGDLARFLESEYAVVGRFIAEPSIEALLRDNTRAGQLN